MQDFFYIKVYRHDSMDPSLSGLCATGNLWPLLRPWSVQAEARPLPDLFHPLRSQQGWDEVKRFPSRTGRAEWSLDCWEHPTLGRAPTTLHEHGLWYSWETQVQGALEGARVWRAWRACGSKIIIATKFRPWQLPSCSFQGIPKWTSMEILIHQCVQFPVGQKLPSIRTFWEFFVHLQRRMSVHSETL